MVFVDESGFSQRPCRVATWAPKGQTPVIQYHFNWDQLSVIAGLTRWNCYFRMYQGAINRFLVVEFLKALVRTIKRPLLILWDSLPAHRSRVVRDYVDSLEGAAQLEFLPTYAPELNPVKYLWANPTSTVHGCESRYIRGLMFGVATTFWRSRGSEGARAV
jgi:hypothetical protein